METIMYTHKQGSNGIAILERWGIPYREVRGSMDYHVDFDRREGGEEIDDGSRLTRDNGRTFYRQVEPFTYYATSPVDSRVEVGYSEEARGFFEVLLVSANGLRPGQTVSHKGQGGIYTLMHMCPASSEEDGREYVCVGSGGSLFGGWADEYEPYS